MIFLLFGMVQSHFLTNFWFISIQGIHLIWILIWITVFHYFFLDLSISKHHDGHLFSDLYRKLIAGNTILEASSFHPKPLLASIPYGQYVCALMKLLEWCPLWKGGSSPQSQITSSRLFKYHLKKAKNVIRSELLFSHKEVETEIQSY